MTSPLVDPEILAILKNKNQGIQLDIGGGGNPQPGFVNMDYRALPGVDIVHNVCMFPWPLPDECVSVAMASHLVEHINPTCNDPRFGKLVELLVLKGVLTAEEVAQEIGETDSPPVFMRFMEEVWRVMKPGGKFMIVVPYAGGTGYWQDPTHVNGCNENTFLYFDPLETKAGGILYNIYKPKPWKIEMNSWQGGNLEVVLTKRIQNAS